jgi:phytanoyl-CoA hydroxylase
MTTAALFIDDPAARMAALDTYASTGCLILEEAFSAPQLARMHAAWARVAGARKAQGKKPFATLLMMHSNTPEVADAVSNPRLVACVEGVLGGEIELIQSQLMFGPPGVKGFSAHQDNYFNRASPADGIVAVWIALEDVDRENGALVVYPESHKGGLVKVRRDWLHLLGRAPDIARSVLRSVLKREEEDDSSVIERFVHAPAGNLKPRTLAMKAGSVAFIHGDLIHWSYPNTTGRFRRSLLANYIRTGTKFAAGKLSGRAAFDVYAAGAH